MAINITKKIKTDISVTLNCNQESADKMKKFLQYFSDHLNSSEISLIIGKLSLPIVQNLALNNLKQYIS